jgi:cytochrome c oxidase subunit 2
VILILVLGLIVFMMVRFARHKSTDPLPKQVHGNTALELGWTIAPAILLAIVAVPTLAAIIDLGREPDESALTVEVEGVQWAWFFTYPDFETAEGTPLESPVELHIPVGREIGFRLTSPDVIHSFWVPRLAGKVDVIPGRVNFMWIKADEPGTYAGQCAEFCGVGHSDMRLTVIVHTEEDFQAWLAEQGASAAPAEGGEEEQQQDEEQEEPAPEGEQATVQE